MAELPDWQPLDQVTAPVSEGTTSGRVVVIVASEGAVASGWAEHGAVALAKTWSSSGLKVMLVDGALQHPSLHAATGVENGEGLSDATLFGASVGRVAHQVKDGGYFLITAGTAVADTNTVVQSPRWDRLARGFVEAGVTLVVFVRDGERGTTAFLGPAEEIVVLAERGEAPPIAVRDLEPLVRVVAGFSKGVGLATSGRAGALRPAAPRKTAAAGGFGPTRRVLAAVLFSVVLAAVIAALLGVVFGIIEISAISPQAVRTAAVSDLGSRLASVTG